KLATLCELTAVTIVKEILSATNSTDGRAGEAEKDNLEIIISGGGIHNPLIIERLKYYLPSATFNDASVQGILPDAKEALLFALLANETISGKPSVLNANNKTPMVCMGKISLPQ